MDPQSWPECQRFDGGTQPCCCWFAERQSEWLEVEGNVWPGGEAGAFRDWITISGQHECNAPFDPSEV